MPCPSHNIHALIAIDGCFDIYTLSWTAINLQSVFYLQICASYFLSKMPIICIWAHKFVFAATLITEYSCPHGNWWLFIHNIIKLNSNWWLVIDRFMDLPGLSCQKCNNLHLKENFVLVPCWLLSIHAFMAIGGYFFLSLLADQQSMLGWGYNVISDWGILCQRMQFSIVGGKILVSCWLQSICALTVVMVVFHFSSISTAIDDWTGLYFQIWLRYSLRQLLTW